MPVHVVRESFGPLFFGNDQVGIEKRAQRCASIPLPLLSDVPRPEQANRMRSRFSHSKSKVDVWISTGHWIMQDRADDVNTAITAWIDAL